MKRLAAAVLGLALSVSVAPAAQAQSLNFGSLGGEREEIEPSVPHWTEGVPYTVGAFANRVRPNEDRCGMSISIDRMNITGLPRGAMGWEDHATGRTYVNEDPHIVWQYVELALYPEPGWSWNWDFFGTNREMTFFIIDKDTEERVDIGTMTVGFPSVCPVPYGVGETVLQTGTIAP